MRVIARKIAGTPASPQVPPTNPPKVPMVDRWGYTLLEKPYDPLPYIEALRTGKTEGACAQAFGLDCLCGPADYYLEPANAREEGE